MDFFILFISYLLVCFAGFVVYIFWDHTILQYGLFSGLQALLNKVFDIIKSCLPSSVKALNEDIYQQFILQRSIIFQVLYLLLVTAGHLILVRDVLPMVYDHKEENHVLIPMILLFINAVLFVNNSLSDPGIITMKNHKKALVKYPYDDIIFQPNIRCSTCLFIKPARSKHCRYLNQCINKFDHFCVWTNNAVGGSNHHYFILFLISIGVMSANGVFMGTHGLIHVTNKYKLNELEFLDLDGTRKPMNMQVLLQTLFMQFPLTVFLVASLSCVTLAITGFAVFHCYLAATNQTTNDRHKKYVLRKHDKTKQNIPNIYDRGIVANFRETFFPSSTTYKTSSGQVKKTFQKDRRYSNKSKYR